MTSAELTLAITLVGLLGMGGGIWFGARGKVTQKECQLRHDGSDRLMTALVERLDRIERKLDDSLGRA